MPTTTQHEIGAFEAKNKFGTLLDWVEAGDEVVITRRGRVVARMVSPNAGHDRAEARRAAEALLAATKGWRLDGVTVNELRVDGRR
ncbi:MAG: type II toxin-antitoxin system prevent-host-death family antitoxin [Betaproteobacteria bacterium]|nr:MAG: type II toxin-antitoxin system prevent-host-death family antitoxin [Betaproteobacteria bacterium]